MFRRPSIPLWTPVGLLATWFGSGLFRRAPGTCGSIAALPFGAAILWKGGNWALLVAALGIYAVGVVVSDIYARESGDKDPSAVVIDEVAGQWLALSPLCLGVDSLLIAFVLFRAFDIAKVWPANAFERRLPGGLGIMTDDMMAGLYAGILSYALLLGIRPQPCFP